MPTNEELNGRLSAIIEEGFECFTKELNAFHENQVTGQDTTNAFLNRVRQYVLLFWGYEYVTKSLGIAEANQVDRVYQIRCLIDGQVNRLQELLNQYRSRQNVMDEVARNAETIAKQKQLFDYTNRLSELTRGGVPYIQAQLIAKQETGYRGY